MPPLLSSFPTDADKQRNHGVRKRDVVVDLPSIVALLPGEADLIVGTLGDVLVALFEEEGKSKGSRRHERQLQDERP